MGIKIVTGVIASVLAAGFVKRLTRTSRVIAGGADVPPEQHPVPTRWEPQPDHVPYGRIHKIVQKLVTIHRTNFARIINARGPSMPPGKFCRLLILSDPHVDSRSRKIQSDDRYDANTACDAEGSIATSKAIITSRAQFMDHKFPYSATETTAPALIQAMMRQYDNHVLVIEGSGPSTVPLTINIRHARHDTFLHNEMRWSVEIPDDRTIATESLRDSPLVITMTDAFDAYHNPKSLPDEDLIVAMFVSFEDDEDLYMDMVVACLAVGISPTELSGVHPLPRQQSNPPEENEKIGFPASEAMIATYTEWWERTPPADRTATSFCCTYFWTRFERHVQNETTQHKFERIVEDTESRGALPGQLVDTLHPSVRSTVLGFLAYCCHTTQGLAKSYDKSRYRTLAHENGSQVFYDAIASIQLLRHIGFSRDVEDHRDCVIAVSGGLVRKQCRGAYDCFRAGPRTYVTEHPAMQLMLLASAGAITDTGITGAQYDLSIRDRILDGESLASILDSESELVHRECVKLSIAELPRTMRLEFVKASERARRSARKKRSDGEGYVYKHKRAARSNPYPESAVSPQRRAVRRARRRLPRYPRPEEVPIPDTDSSTDEDL